MVEISIKLYLIISYVTKKENCILCNLFFTVDYYSRYFTNKIEFSFGIYLINVRLIVGRNSINEEDMRKGTR